MKQITRTKGKHKGIHYIFDNGYSEAIHYLNLPQLRSHNTNNQDFSGLDCFPHWMMGDVKEGDWITTDNGVVIQLLRIYKGKEWVTKGQHLWELRILKTVAGCGYYIYYLKDGIAGTPAGTKYNRAQFAITEATIAENRARQTMGNGITVAGRKKLWKRLFVYYLVIYCSPVFAYQLMMKQRLQFTKNNKMLTYGQAQKHAYAMMQDPFVVAELEKYMKVDSFRDRLTNALAAQGIGEERIVEELSTGLDAVKKGTQTHKQFIELAMNISRYAKEKEQIGPDGKALAKIESADYTESTMLPPPPRKDIYEKLDTETIELVNKSISMNVDKVELPLVEGCALPPVPSSDAEFEELEQLQSELTPEDIEENKLLEEEGKLL